MFWNKEKKEAAKAEWFNLTKESQLDEIVKESEGKTVLIFKHSTSCSISNMSLNRFTRGWEQEYSDKLKPYYLDLLSFRNVSNAVADRFGVHHQSPQVVLIKNGNVVHEASHMAISFDAIKREL